MRFIFEFSIFYSTSAKLDGDSTTSLMSKLIPAFAATFTNLSSPRSITSSKSNSDMPGNFFEDGTRIPLSVGTPVRFSPFIMLQKVL